MNRPFPDRRHMRKSWPVTRSHWLTADLLDSDSLRTAHSLQVQRVSYASPGFSDFTGFGQAMSALKDIIIKIIDTNSSAGERKRKVELLDVQIEQERLRKERIRLEIIKDKMDILQKAGCDQGMLQRIAAEVDPALKFIETAAHEGLISNATIQNDG